MVPAQTDFKYTVFWFEGCLSQSFAKLSGRSKLFYSITFKLILANLCQSFVASHYAKNEDNSVSGCQSKTYAHRSKM